MEDRTIVEMYLNRNENAIKQTKEKYGHRLQALSENIVQDVQTAEECVNDTYLEAWNLIPPNEPRDYLYSFLARIVRHISLNSCRRKNRLKRNGKVLELTAEMEQCIPDTHSVDNQINQILLQETINKFLSELETEKRIIFMRRYWYLDSISQISRQFNFTESKVKTILFRCRNKLREQLEKEDFNI
ncbi:MAG: RNA polymerase sigma factor [Ruminococcus sp.]